MNVRIVAAMLKKDVRSLPWPISLVALLFLADPLIVRLDLLPVWSQYGQLVVLAALFMLITTVVQLDSAASLTDDWRCRPVPGRELLVAKLLLVAAAVYLPRAIGAFSADLILGLPLPECALDALLLQDWLSLLLLPMFAFIAIITRTFVQAFSVQFAIFIAVFVLPTPFVRPPGPMSPGLREELFVSGLQWLSTTPARVASFGLLAIGIWLVYGRHRLFAARVLMGVSAVIFVSLVALPMGFLRWESMFAIQSAVGPAPTADIGRITLRNTKACFAAARRADVAGDPRFGSWDEEALRDIGPNAIAFVTEIEARGAPLDARALLNYVEADYLDGDRPLYSLRPARYSPRNGGADALRHEWVLPESAVHRLRAADARLRLTYSVTLVQPREFSVPTDGRHHRLPGLGWCGATAADADSHLVVDCFVPGASRPPQISAQLDEIPASRVFGRPDFSPRATRWAFGERVVLTIPWARLAKHDTITISAWDAAGPARKALTMPGILGAAADACPLPDAGRPFAASVWRDSAPHEAHSIGVDDGVQLEVLDFGGAGAPIVLLPGLGATAHSYDELAPRLARDHRVIALTRRGTGASTAPDFGYGTQRLSEDVLRVMESMQLENVLLVGHSIAGDELTWLGGHHGDRFRGLVYLDAAYDRSRPARRPSRLRELNALLPPEPPIPSRAFASYDAMTALLASRGHLPVPEGELIAFWHANDPALAGTPAIHARSQQAIAAAIETPDYTAVKTPALAIYAMRNPDEPLPPWYDANDTTLTATLAQIAQITDAKKRRDIETFRTSVAHGEVLELPNAEHSIVQSNPADVLAAIEAFDARLEAGARR